MFLVFEGETNMPAPDRLWLSLSGSGVRSNMRERSFPAPWRIEAIPEGYRVLDANGIVLAYVVAHISSGEAPVGDLTLDEARRIADVISNIPALLKKFGA